MTLCIYNYVVTLDVQSVNAKVVDESTVEIQCWFIHGSNVLGMQGGIAIKPTFKGITCYFVSLWKARSNPQNFLLSSNAAMYQGI